MKSRYAFILLGVCLISGCHGFAHLYPVQGPLASLTPPPVYTAEINLVANWSKPMTVGVHANDKQGKISVVLANGEAFNGLWKEVYDKSGPQDSASNVLAGAWDTVYEKGFYVSHVLGSPLFVHTAMTGSQGTDLTVEWFEVPYGVGDQERMVAKGIAVDSKGDIFKLSF